MKVLFTALLSLFMLSGCTKAIMAEYDANIVLKDQNSISDQKVAVYPFEDERSWIDASDEKSKSFIAQQGVWKFGINYEGVDYLPVSDVLQDIFIKEFKYVGVDAFKATETVAGAYSLKGKILNFEFENEEGLFTVTSKRHVSLALTLEDPEGHPVFSNELFNALDRENEGLGVLHSTNVEKLMTGALKTAVTSVINRFNQELAKAGEEEIIVTLNGVRLNMQSDYVQYSMLASVN